MQICMNQHFWKACGGAMAPVHPPPLEPPLRIGSIFQGIPDIQSIFLSEHYLIIKLNI